MSAGPILFALFALALGACAIAARGAWVRAASFCVTVGLAAALWQSSLGRPRTPLFEHPAGTVVSYRFDEPHAIYLWMLRPGERTPTAYILPWSERQAAQLQEAAEKAKKAGEPLEAKGPPKRRGAMAWLAMARQDEYRFYPAEHQALPPKSVASD